MTELQIAIGHLKESISVGNVLLAKMEAKQKDLDWSKFSSFPSRFIVVADKDLEGQFLIGLRDPDRPGVWRELPKDFSGRAAFSEADLRQIIVGLQTLLGDSNG